MSFKRLIPRKTGILFGMLGLVFLLVGWTAATTPVKGPHSPIELAFMREEISGLTVQFGTYFVTAGRCAGCHGHDPNGVTMIAGDNEDVNVVDDWRSTMMANAANDPFFLAKMQHEGLVNPHMKEQIEHGCLKCHAPLAVFEDAMLGNPPFTAASLDTSVFARDGVSCLACHMQNPASGGHVFSGNLVFDSARVWGPYTDEQINPYIMQYFINYTPDQGSNILDGSVCAGCHTAINQPVDLEGNPTGTSFYEQTLWQEYKNSVYYGTEQNCRSCHMPRIQDSVRLASEYLYLPGQSPFGKHHLTGGGVFMLKMMKDHIGEFGLPATPAQFDSTIARSIALRATAMEMDLQVAGRSDDTLFLDVGLTNLTGHKFPGGFPNRRAFLQVLALSAGGDTLFNSGSWDGNYEVIGNDLPYEPHHDVIRDGGQAQIYEFVMGDVNHDATTTLLRAVHRLKDNRLVPIGYSLSHPSQDTTAVAGLALNDPDFNRDADGVEGNGGDIVHYHIPLGGYDGAVEVKARLWFQQVPPRWNQEMFSHHGSKIDPFRDMYLAADNTPELVVADSMVVLNTGLKAPVGQSLQAYPNPTRDGIVNLAVRDVQQIKAYDAAGRQVPIAVERMADGWRCVLPEQPGVYHLVATTPQGSQMMRVVRSGR
ncbi:MAG TPA: multiheme c-type cytochrome [Flavobacteriales bacterium]|nr:multiheme c-type cytochrome [Flavobacteriales bacterium]